MAAGADVNATVRESSGGFFSSSSVIGPLLYFAIWNGDPEIIGILVDAGADVNATFRGSSSTLGGLFGSSTTDTPLIHYAARYSTNPAVIQVLLDAGANIHAKDDDGQTPLHYAARWNRNQALIQVLLDAGADIEEKTDDRYGWTPLHRSVINENLTAVQALLEADADINAENNFGWMVLHLATRYNDHPSVIQALLGRRIRRQWEGPWPDATAHSCGKKRKPAGDPGFAGRRGRYQCEEQRWQDASGSSKGRKKL